MSSGCCAGFTAALVLSLLTIANPVSALDPHKHLSQFAHTSWSERDGVPGPVRALAQTADGYLWLGTQAGLYRFDGLRFVPFEMLSSEAPRSPAWSLCVARDGSLWIGFASGQVSRLQNGRVVNFEPSEHGLPGAGILSIAQDRSGVMWAAGPYGFSRFDGHEWRRVGSESGFAAPGAQSILVDRQGTLWVATDGLNYKLGPDPVRTNTILSLDPGAHLFRPTGQAVGMVWSMGRASDGEPWIAETTDGDVRPLRKGRDVRVRAESPRCLLFDRDDGLWIGAVGTTRRALASGRDSTSRMERFTVAEGLSGVNVYSSLEDREGNIWLGTDGGLDRFRENKATPFTAREGLKYEGRPAIVASPDGSVWTASYTGGFVERIRSGEVHAFRLPRYGLELPRILAMSSDSKGGLWLGGSFFVAQESNGAFHYVPAASSPSQVEAVAQDSSGDLWITLSPSGGVGKILRRRSGRWAEVDGSIALPKYRCRVLYGDPKGRMWLGFENGAVFVYDHGNFRGYSSPDGLPNGRILAISSDDQGRIMVGSEGGLSRLEGRRFSTLTEQNGLPGNSVSAILADDDRNLWLAGALGVCRAGLEEIDRAFVSPSYRIRAEYFDALDGLPGLPRQREPFPTATRSADGRLWFSTSRGIAVFDPHQLPRNGVLPPVVIESVRADDRPMQVSTPMRLPPHTKRLEIRYSALSLMVPERVRFRYRLDGYDRTWRGPLKDREASYTNLSPRQYRFRLMACNNDGVWNETETSLDFEIRPAFYQTRWFYLLELILAASLIWVGYRWRIRRVANVIDLKFRERLSERTRIAQDLHDSLLQGVLSASMQLSVAVDDVPRGSNGRPRLDRVLQLLRQVVTDGRMALQGLRVPDPGVCDLAQVLSRIRAEAAFDGSARFRVVVLGTVRSLRPSIRDEAYHIGREALLNAFRHARAGDIELQLEYAAKGLRMIVTDDGDGIAADVLRTGREGHWGLPGMNERATQMGARLAVRSRPDSGTEVVLSIPGRIAYLDESSGSGLRRMAQWLSRRTRAVRSTRPKQ